MSATVLEAPPSTYATPATDAVVETTAAALRERGFEVFIADDAAEARALTLAAIPAGAEVGEASSRTLVDLGISAAIEESGDYQALKPRLWSMDRATQANEIRKLGSAPDVLVGSVHAITEGGQVLAASMSGSQLTGYSSGAGKVIWVVGTQKIVPDFAAAMDRIESYVFPLEDARAQEAYGVHSAINKLLVVNGDFPGRVTIVLVKDAVGF